MKPHYVLAAAIAATSVLALAAAPEPLPKPWFITGQNPKNYEGGVDQSEGYKGAKFIRNKSGGPEVWGALMQLIAADNYRGQRVRFRARIRTENVTNWAGLWLRIDTPNNDKIHIYNSSDKPIKGTTGWETRTVVLDVPANATAIAFGAIDEGLGQVWLDQMALETVGMDVPVDIQQEEQKLPLTPTL